jgi:AraC-like DNA-binding protein
MSFMAIELIVRTAAWTAALFLAVALARTPQARFASRAFGAALCLGAASYVAFAGVSLSRGGASWTWPFLLLAVEVPFFFYGWTTSIVDDEFRLSPLAVGGAALLLVIGVLGMMTDHQRSSVITITLHSVLGIGFVISALVNVLRGWRQDLLEARRRLRAVIVILCGGYSIAIMAVEVVLAGKPPNAELALLNSISLAALLCGLACAVLDLGTKAQAAFGWTAPVPGPVVEPAQVTARDREQEIVERLNDLMTKGAAYRKADLTVASLAARLGIAEKKLREVINNRLGFKNFPAYVNAFRLEEVRRRLLDHHHDQVPILTMALDAGFGSIAVFNRAFKEKYAMTPTAYRVRRDDVPAISANEMANDGSSSTPLAGR